MKKLLKWIAVASLFILEPSCSKNNDSPVAPPCLLTKLSSTFSSSQGEILSSVILTFEYDANSRLTKLVQASTFPNTPTATYTYTYVNNLVSTVSYSNTLGDTSTASWTHENGYLTKVAGSNNFASLPDNKFTTFYTYDSQGKLNNVHLITSQADAVTLTPTYSSDGNLSTADIVITFNGTTISNQYTYSGYDVNNAPYNLLAKATGEIFFVYNIEGFVEPEYLFKNNPSTGNNGRGDCLLTYTYEINAKKYPTKTTQTNCDGSSLVSLMEYKGCS